MTKVDFILGVLSSLTATILLELWRNRVKELIDTVTSHSIPHQIPRQDKRQLQNKPRKDILLSSEDI